MTCFFSHIEKQSFHFLRCAGLQRCWNQIGANGCQIDFNICCIFVAIFVYFVITKVRIKSDKQKNVAKLLADRRFRKMA